MEPKKNQKSDSNAQGKLVYCKSAKVRFQITGGKRD